MSIEVKRFVQGLEQAVGQQILAESLKLSKGQCKDFAEYRNKTGMIAGLEAAVGIAKEMRNKMDIDDDDKQRQGAA